MPNWQQVLHETQARKESAQSDAINAADHIRRHYLKKLHNKSQRNVIAYYSGWLSKQALDSSINDEDKNGFMMCVHKLDRSKGLDLILHTPGGSIAATQSIVDYLHKMFGDDIRAIVPQIAMSAGTIIACSCKTILMAKHSNLGPIDPQVNGWPAYGVLQEFKKACREVKSDPSKANVWRAIIGQYKPAFLGQCQDAITWSNRFVREQLRDVMFKGEPKATEKAIKIVRWLSSKKQHASHAQHVHADACKKNGLKIEMIEDDDELQDLILTVHHCYMHAFQSTATYKAIENHLGVGVFKQQQAVKVK